RSVPRRWRAIHSSPASVPSRQSIPLCATHPMAHYFRLLERKVQIDPAPECFRLENCANLQGTTLADFAKEGIVISLLGSFCGECRGEGILRNRNPMRWVTLKVRR